MIVITTPGEYDYKGEVLEEGIIIKCSDVLLENLSVKNVDIGVSVFNHQQPWADMVDIGNIVIQNVKAKGCQFGFHHQGRVNGVVHNGNTADGNEVHGFSCGGSHQGFNSSVWQHVRD